jgi:hypothetical protein
LPIPIDLAASSYQLLDLSLALFLLDGPFAITDPLSFEVGALAPSFLGNGFSHFTVSFYHLVGAAEPSLSAYAVCWGASLSSQFAAPE